jgi:hypothetical protein
MDDERKESNTMSTAAKVLLAVSLLLCFGSCMSFYLSGERQTQEFTLWSDTPSEMTFLDWLGIVLIVIGVSLGMAAYKLDANENRKHREIENQLDI